MVYLHQIFFVHGYKIAISKHKKYICKFRINIRIIKFIMGIRGNALILQMHCHTYILIVLFRLNIFWTSQKFYIDKKKYNYNNIM